MKRSSKRWVICVQRGCIGKRPPCVGYRYGDRYKYGCGHVRRIPKDQQRRDK